MHGRRERSRSASPDERDRDEEERRPLKRHRKSSEETEIMLDSDDHDDQQESGLAKEAADDKETKSPRKPVPLYPPNFTSGSSVEGMIGSFPGSEHARSQSATPVGFPLPQYTSSLAGYPALGASSPGAGICLPGSGDSMDSFLNSTAFYSGKGQANQGDTEFIPHFVFTPRHPMGKKYFRCPQCRYYTDRKNNLKRHIGTMHQDCGKVLECCEIMFRSKAALRDHIMLFHRTGYRCKHCGRNFCRKALLKRHLAVHGGQKEYYCDTCDYATSQRASFDRHTRNHALKTSFGSGGEDEENLDGKLGGAASAAQQADQLNFWYLTSGYLPESIFPYHQRPEGTLLDSQIPLSLLDRQKLANQSGDEPASAAYANLTGNPSDESREPKEKRGRHDREGKDEKADDDNMSQFREMAMMSGNLSLFNKRLFDRPYKCNDCSSTFSNQQKFRDHVKQCKRPDHTEPQQPLNLLMKPKHEKDEVQEQPLCLKKEKIPEAIGKKPDRTSRYEPNNEISGRLKKPTEEAHPVTEKVDRDFKNPLNYFGRGYPFTGMPLYKPLDLSHVIRPEPFFPFSPFGWLGGSSPLSAPGLLPWRVGGLPGQAPVVPEASQGAAPLSPPESSPSPQGSPRGSPLGGNETDGSQGGGGDGGSSLPLKKRLLHS